MKNQENYLRKGVRGSRRFDRMKQKTGEKLGETQRRAEVKGSRTANTVVKITKRRNPSLSLDDWYYEELALSLPASRDTKKQESKDQGRVFDRWPTPRLSAKNFGSSSGCSTANTRERQCAHPGHQFGPMASEELCEPPIGEVRFRIQAGSKSIHTIDREFKEESSTMRTEAGDGDHIH